MSRAVHVRAGEVELEPVRAGVLAVASEVCQFFSSLSLPEPAMMEAMSTRSGNASLIRRMRGSHQSRVLSEMSSQFQEECSAAPGRFFMET